MLSHAYIAAVVPIHIIQRVRRVLHVVCVDHMGIHGK